jgi:hypothetical protein
MATTPKLNFYDGNYGAFAQMIYDGANHNFDLTNPIRIANNTTIVGNINPSLSFTDGGANAASMTYQVSDNKVVIDKAIQPTTIMDIANSKGTNGQVLTSTGGINLLWANPYTMGTVTNSLGSTTVNAATYTNINTNPNLTWTGKIVQGTNITYKINVCGKLIGANTKCGAYLQVINVTQGTTQSSSLYISGSPFVFDTISFNGTDYNQFNIDDFIILPSYAVGDQFNVNIYVITATGTHTFTNGFYTFTLTPVNTSF